MKSIIRNSKIYTLDSDHGKVSYLMRAGEDMVRNVMSENGAMEMIANGNVCESNEFSGHPIAVDNKFFFPGTVEDDHDTVESESAPAPSKKWR